MNDFTLFLPAEALLNIFSYIDQLSCIQCTRVCRNWFQRIPPYTRDIWKEIILSPDSWPTANDCLVQCLGPHTQKLSIHSMDAANVLRAFKSKHCDLKSLEIITDTKPDVHDGLFSAINQFEYTLSELAIIDHSISLSWVQLLRLPYLTHLTRVGGALVSHDPENDPITAIQPMTSLTYLELDGIFDFDTGLVPILRCCPNIMTLVVSMDYQDYQMTSEGIKAPPHFDTMFDLCPNIHFLAWNTVVTVSETMAIINRWKQLERVDGIPKGVVREFIFWGDGFDFEQVLPVIKRSEHELECLKLSECVWGARVSAGALADMHFCRLRTLMMSDVELTEREWVQLLSHCEKLEILSMVLETKEVHLDTLIQAIQESLKWLKRFRLVDNEYFTYLVHSQICRKLDVFSQSTMLESLDLGICCGENVLLDLCRIPSLKELKLELSSMHGTCTQVEDILAFSEKLKDTNIHTLAVRNLTNMTDDALEHCGRAKQLKRLSIAGHYSITNAGIKRFIASHGEKELSISDCKML